MQGQGCQPHAVPFQQDGTSYLLYTANSLSQWLSQGESGLLAFDGTQFTWVWPVEGDVREEGSAARRPMTPTGRTLWRSLLQAAWTCLPGRLRRH